MARIRSSKPEWWTSAKWCRLPRDIRSTYKGIWEVMCDDEGRFLADPRQVKADVWPLDDDITPKKLTGWLPKLATVTVTLKTGERVPAVQFYELDGVQYGFLPGFVKHQKISHPTPSKLPQPPDILRNHSGTVQENIPPDKDRDFDFDLERSGEETPPRVVLPPEAERFLNRFYEPALTPKQRDRYRDIQSQLYDVLDSQHPGVKIRGGIRVKARSMEHLADELNAVLKDPPPDRDLAIVWLLKRLTNPPKGPSVTDAAKQRESVERGLEERYQAEAKRAGVVWANEHPDEYKPIASAIEATFRGKTGTFADIAKQAALTQKCSQAAGFPSFEQWKSQRQPGVTAA